MFFPHICFFLPGSRWEKRWLITQTGKPVNHLILIPCASLQYYHLCPLLGVKLWWCLFVGLQQSTTDNGTTRFARMSQSCWWCAMVIFSFPIPFLFRASAFAGMKAWTTAVPLIGCLAGGVRLHGVGVFGSRRWLRPRTRDRCCRGRSGGVTWSTLCRFR